MLTRSALPSEVVQAHASNGPSMFKGAAKGIKNTIKGYKRAAAADQAHHDFEVNKGRKVGEMFSDNPGPSSSIAEHNEQESQKESMFAGQDIRNKLVTSPIGRTPKRADSAAPSRIGKRVEATPGEPVRQIRTASNPNSSLQFKSL